MSQQLSTLIQNNIAIDIGAIIGTVPVLRGGTGATTAASALTNLGAYAASNPSGYTTNTGTVTSMAALTLGTTGTDVGSTVATGTTTPVITLNIPTASATNRGALSSANWTTFNGKQAALGFTPENVANKGAASGYAPLDATSKISSTYLPSYVDDVLEYANLAALPVTGTAGLIYVTVDTNKTYRWSGSAYVEISASPGSTDAVTEGTTNKYYTDTRARTSISATQNITYNSSTGVITGPVLSGYLTAEADTLATVTARGATTTVVPTFSKGLTAGSSVPFYHLTLDFGADAAGSWRIIGTVALTNSIFSSAAYKITITDPNGNYGGTFSVNADEYTYYIACTRSDGNALNTPDSCVVKGPYSHIRAVKTSVGNYQIQVSNEQQWDEYLITIQSYVNHDNLNAITFLDGTTVGGAGTAVYAASVGAATEHFQKINTLGGAVIQGLTVGLGANAVGGNTALGVSALSGASQSGYNNVAIGTSALAANSSGGENVSVGVVALQTNAVGSGNVGVGAYALNLNTGSSNIGVGRYAGNALTTGSNNTIIGSVAGTAGLSDTVIIAAGAAERLRIDSSGNVGIGTTTPGSKLTVAGTALVSQGLQVQLSSYGYKIYTGGAALKYYVASFPINDTGNMSSIHITGVFGGWLSATKNNVDIIAGNRDGLTVQFREGSATGSYGFELYTEANSTISVWLYLAAWQTAAFDISNVMQATTFLNPSAGTPTGTLIYTTETATPNFKINGQIESTLTGYKFPDGTVQASAATGAPTLVIVTTTTQTAASGNHYVLTNAAATTLTLPASPVAGNLIYVTSGNALATNVIAYNGNKIMGLSENLTINTTGYTTMQLRYLNATIGWALI